MYYNDNGPATLVFTGDPGSNLELYPSDIRLLLDEKYGKNAIINTWMHCAKIKALCDDNGKVTLTISWDGYQIEISVPNGMPIFIGIRKTYVKTGAIKLPWLLNDRVAWALGLRNSQNKELPKSWHQLCVGTMTLAYNYSSITATWPNMFNLAFDGPITRLDAIKALEVCLDNMLYFSSPSRIYYLLDMLTN